MAARILSFSDFRQARSRRKNRYVVQARDARRVNAEFVVYSDHGDLESAHMAAIDLRTLPPPRFPEYPQIQILDPQGEEVHVFGL